MTAQQIKTKPVIEVVEEFGDYLRISRISPALEHGPPVVLFHGGNVSSAMFTSPSSSDEKVGGIANYLRGMGADVWLVDWRASAHPTTSGRPGRDDNSWHQKMTLDDAADSDVVSALRCVKKMTNSKHVGLLGHCLGGTILSMAIAGGQVTKAWGRSGVSAVVTGVGLFCHGSTENQVKVADQILEFHGAAPDARWLDPVSTVEGAEPDSTWPTNVRRAFDRWKEFSGHDCRYRSNPDTDDEFADLCQRLSFLFGCPYEESQLHEAVHRWELIRQFGAIHTKLFLHGARNLRRGWVAPFNTGTDRSEHHYVSDAALQEFSFLEQITLCTGARNQLWHRDSIDRMYEWLGRDNRIRQRIAHKRVFEAYGHQDLYWGKRSILDIYPTLASGLLPPTACIRSREVAQ